MNTVRAAPVRVMPPATEAAGLEFFTVGVEVVA